MKLRNISKNLYFLLTVLILLIGLIAVLEKKILTDNNHSIPVSSCMDSTSPISTLATDKIGAIIVFCPNGGEEWEIGNEYEIKWKIGKYSDDSVRIYLINDDLYSNPIIIQSSFPNTGIYQWVIPKWITVHIPGGTEDKVEISTSKNYRILIENIRTGESDSSDYPFTIVASNSAF